jgi:hypothetical protein
MIKYADNKNNFVTIKHIWGTNLIYCIGNGIMSNDFVQQCQAI